jgi:hypothetical protein
MIVRIMLYRKMHTKKIYKSKAFPLQKLRVCLGNRNARYRAISQMMKK